MPMLSRLSSRGGRGLSGAELSEPRAPWVNALAQEVDESEVGQELVALREMASSPPLMLTTVILIAWSINTNAVFATVVENSGVGAEAGGQLITIASVAYSMVGPIAGAPPDAPPHDW
eukprot:1188358-Prorocentrum_minimum.AAC.3